MPRRPPPSSLFPYTTLFRSSIDGHRVAVVGLERLEAHSVGVAARRCGPPGADRKSTRLNSSHRCISYSVFCLKKTTGGPLGTETGRSSGFLGCGKCSPPRVE